MYAYNNYGCCGNNMPYYPVNTCNYGNNNSSFAIILVLFILLVIVIGARTTR